MTTDTPLFTSERLKAFVDAVVAIAMTLLILPLMESASEDATEQRENPGFDTLQFLEEHKAQIWALTLSFALIALAWTTHHRIYAAVEKLTTKLIWLNVLWMFMIICLPVTTALVGSMHTDPLQTIIYIGNLILLQLSSMFQRLYLLRHPELVTAPRSTVIHGIIADVVATGLFAIALAISLLAPVVSYTALFLLILTGPLTRLFNRDHDGDNGNAPSDRADRGNDPDA